MFPYDSKDLSRKRKFFEVGNTSADPFGLYSNVDAFYAPPPRPCTTLKHDFKNLMDRPLQYFSSLLLHGSSSEDDDENLDVFRQKCKGEVVPLDPLMESDHKINLHTRKNETDGLWSWQIVKEAEKLEEKDAQIQKLSSELYDKTKQLVSCQLENIVLEKKTKMAVKKFKSLRKSMKKILSRRLLRTKHVHVVSRPGAAGQEETAESSFVVTQRNEEAWLFCKVCETRMANMIICPCKHLSVCRRCDATITKCPICDAAKITSVEVCLP
ncbi:uncharacterized protein LOC141701495 [Apium graveolens]|uniref:RING-type domain-containing protein n=1 Tax=Apium graveolens TaxID=4045 RepID=A0A6L5B9F5_APIGR|nr:hypothetical protein AG4045_029396 [Apium graveolens]